MPVDMSERVAEFRALYLENLKKQIEKHPDQYRYPASQAEVVGDKMIAAFSKGPHTINASPAWKAAAKKLGFTSQKKLWDHLFGSP